MRRVLLPSLLALLLLPFSAAGPVPPLTPSAPQDLVALGGVGRIDLSWSAPDDAGAGVTGYRVYRDGALIATVPPNTTTFANVGLNVSSTHTYAVRASTLLVQGPPSNNATATTSAQPPAPVGLVASGGVRAVTLRWTGHGEGTFRVYRDGALVAEVAATTHNDSGLADGTSYVYRVSGVHGGVEGAQSAAANATTRAVPGAPTNLTARAGAGAIDLSWNAPRSSGNLTYRVYADLGGWTLVGTTSRTGFRDAPVAAGEARTYRVTAVDGVGESAPSNTASATAFGMPGAPQDLQAQGDDVGIVLAWRAPASDGGSPVESYHVYAVSSNGTRLRLADVSANQSSYRDLTVAPGESRTYVVTARNAAGEGDASDPATGTRDELASSRGQAAVATPRLPLRVVLRIEAEF